MATPEMNVRHINFAVHAMARILIASYFVAGALGIVVDPHGTALVEFVFPSTATEAAVAGLVFICGFLVMVGTQVRLAALALAVYVLWSSFIINMGTTLMLDAFWRDIALIGGLLMTYSNGEVSLIRKRKPQGRAPFARKVTPRRITVVARDKPEIADDEASDSQTSNIFA